jgi:hypothetical protein
MSDKSFESTLEKISLFFKILYLWIVAYVFYLTISYSGFLVLFARSS